MIVLKVLAIVFLLGAILFNPPYGYYQIMRIALVIIFFKLAMHEYEEERTVMSVLASLCIVLFQPLEKLAFNKHQWQIIDIGCAALLLLWILWDVKNFIRNTI